MPLPSYGAAPLSKTFLVVRVLQVISMIIIVGISANFISNIVSKSIEPPKEFAATLSVTCIAALYCLVSIAFFWSQAQIGLFVMAGVDGLLLIAFIVVAVTLGKPVSYLNCYEIPDFTADVDASNAYGFTVALASSLNITGSENSLPLALWAAITKSNCFQTKALWGVSIALCLLFTTSCALLPTLWYKNKKVGGYNKSAV